MLKEFHLVRSQRVRLDGQLFDEVRVTSGVSQESVLGPLLFLAYFNDIWRNIDSSIRFADDCIVYRKITDSSDIGKLQTDLNRLRECTVGNEMQINLGKSNAVNFTKARVKERIRHYFED